jgi:hypothetical protein
MSEHLDDLKKRFKSLEKEFDSLEKRKLESKEDFEKYLKESYKNSEKLYQLLSDIAN